MPVLIDLKSKNKYTTKSINRTGRRKQMNRKMIKKIFL